MPPGAFLGLGGSPGAFRGGKVAILGTPRAPQESKNRPKNTPKSSCFFGCFLELLLSTFWGPKSAKNVGKEVSKRLRG